MILEANSLFVIYSPFLSIRKRLSEPVLFLNKRVDPAVTAESMGYYKKNRGICRNPGIFPE
jgi:hypothetical protein